MSVILDPIFGCQLATGRTDKDGYAFLGRSRAHIVAYEAAVGPIGDGLVLDHMCNRRNCVAPHHLEAVTQSVNLYRRNWRNRSRIKLCPKGHSLDINAIVTPEMGRVCRACNREARP